MRLSHLFFTTLRDDPAEAEMPSHRLLLRAGYVRPLGSGIYSLLPLGFRASKRVEQIIREEQDRIGAQEIEMPVVHPAEVWKESGRYFKIGPELVRFKDRGDRDMVLAMTHEEVVALLLRDIVQSYRQLPMMVYHFQTKFRDEPRSRGGLIRVREFVMKDAYSCDRDEAGLDKSYRDQYEAYERTFKRLGLDAIAVGADVGIMGGIGRPRVHGPERLRRGHARPVRQLRLRREPADRRASASPIRSPKTRCRWRTSRRRARRRSRHWRRSSACPAVGPPRRRSSSTGDGRFVVAIVRGDYDVNETKLVNAIKATGGLRPATVEEIKARGMEAGYGSPLGARDAVVVVDELVMRSPNLVAGREPGRLAREERQRPARLHAGRRRRDHEAREGDPVHPSAASRSSSARGSRSATSSSSGPTSRTRSGRCTWARTASGTPS